MQERDKSASTIKTGMAAICFFHDKMERTKYCLPSNDELAVELGRHSFAARVYQELIGSGMNPLSASLRVSRLLGHERPDITRGCLVSLPKGEYQPYSGHKNK